MSRSGFEKSLTGLLISLIIFPDGASPYLLDCDIFQMLLYLSLVFFFTLLKKFFLCLFVKRSILACWSKMFLCQSISTLLRCGKMDHLELLWLWKTCPFNVLIENTCCRWKFHKNNLVGCFFHIYKTFIFQNLWENLITISRKINCLKLQKKQILIIQVPAISEPILS